MTPTQREAIELAIADFEHIPAASGHVEFVERRIAALRAALAEPAPVQEQQPAPASKPVLLQCLGCERVGTQEQLSASTDCDCWLHTQPAPVQEPSHDVVAGAIFDFAGFLTTHKDKIGVGSSANAGPMVERIKEWSDKRGLSLENPDVFGWQMRTAQPRKAVKLSEEVMLDVCRKQTTLMR